MFLSLVNVKAKYVIISLVISLLIIGCKEKENTNVGSANPDSPISSGFVLDFNDVNQPQVLKSELFLRFVVIYQQHIRQQQPTMYSNEDITKITSHYVLIPEKKEWILDRMDIHLKDGSVKSEKPLKGWNVKLDVELGKGQNPILIEQHFEAIKKPNSKAIKRIQYTPLDTME